MNFTFFSVSCTLFVFSCHLRRRKKNGSPSICSAILNSPKLHHHHHHHHHVHVCSTNLNIPKLHSSNLFWFFSTIFELPKFAISGWLQKSKTSQICIIRFEPFDNRIIIFFFHYTSGKGKKKPSTTEHGTTAAAGESQRSWRTCRWKEGISIKFFVCFFVLPVTRVGLKDR